MNLSADVMGNEPHDALAVGCGETLAGIRQAPRQPIDPEPAIGIEHDLDDRQDLRARPQSPVRARCAACAHHARPPRIERNELPRSPPTPPSAMELGGGDQ